MQNSSVAHIITGLSRGGAENVLYRLIQAQSDPSLHSVISLLDEGIFGERLRALNVEVRCLGLSRGSVPSPMAVWRLSRWLKQIRPTVVQTWMYHADLLGGLAARLVSIPVCWGLHHSNLMPSRNKRSTLRIVRLNAWLSGSLPSSIVSCSARAVQIHRELGYANKFIVIPNGLDLAHFGPLNQQYRDSIRQRFNFPGGSKVVGHLGRSDPQKDHATLLSVFAQVAARRNDVYLLLAGMGLEYGSPYLDKLLAQTGAAAFATRIRALGQRDDVPDLMAAMDVFLLSSVGEAFPNVVVEAMACGTPCVVTDVGDAAEIVGDTGWVSPSGNVGQLAVAVLDSLAESEGTHALRRHQARRRVEDNFGIERMVKSYREAWDSAAESVRIRLQ